MSNISKSFQIVFPVYNEENRMEKSIIKTIDFLELNHYKNYSILIADNLSKDRTPIIAKELVNRFEKVSYLYVNQKGIGVALRAAWQKSEYDIIGYMDIDLSTSLIYLNQALNILDNDEADIVIGSRLSPESKVKNRILLREIVSRCYNFAIKHYLGFKLSDAVCGFKFLKREVFDQIMKRGAIKANHWFFDTELLIKAEWSNFKTLEIPIDWVDDQDSRVNLVEDTIKYLKEMRRLKKEKNEFKKKKV